MVGQSKLKTPPKTSAATKKRIANPCGGHLPKKDCLACKQHTHQLDRDCGAEKFFLYWTKSELNARGVGEIIGNECFYCFDTRRARFIKVSMAELNDMREKDSELDAKCIAWRRARVRGEEEQSPKSWTHRSSPQGRRLMLTRTGSAKARSCSSGISHVQGDCRLKKGQAQTKKRSSSNTLRRNTPCTMLARTIKV